MGCRAVTPHLVSLARRHQDKPFHLIATHRQGRPKDEVVAFIKGFGLSGDVSNFSVTNGGRHPGVAGNGYVPYYMIFDHTGRLVYDHMCGDYHGGDGLKMIEIVNKLLKEAQEIYLGKEPFAVIPKLAAQVAKKKRLAAAVKKIETELAGQPDRARRAELQRLHDAVQAWHDRTFDGIVKLSGTNPPAVIPSMKRLANDLKGTKMGGHSARNLAALQKNPDKTAIRLFKGLQKARKAIAKLKDASPKAIEKHAKRLAKLIEGHENLPISKTIREYIESLG